MRRQLQQRDPYYGTQALNIASGQGFDIDIDSIQPPVMSQQYLQVNTQLYFGTSSGAFLLPLSTFHAPVANMLNVTSGTVNASNLRLDVTAGCSSQNCNPYYLVISVYNGSQPVIQLGARKYFTNGVSMDSGYDIYQWMPANNFLSFENMKAYLDGGQAPTNSFNDGLNNGFNSFNNGFTF
jgi:hypothetical protein